MTNAEINKLKEVIEGMSHEEKVVAVGCIPTEILEAEIKHRLRVYEEQNNQLRELINNMERH